MPSEPLQMVSSPMPITVKHLTDALHLQSLTYFPLKEVRPHRVEEVRRHRSIAIAAELLAALYNLEEEA